MLNQKNLLKSLMKADTVFIKGLNTLELFSYPQSKQVLEKNNVMTIEPGIYLAGWGGVRIEDDVIIGDDGCEILNKTTKDLVVLN